MPVNSINCENMVSERSSTVLRSLPDSHLYPAIMLVLLLVTALSLSIGMDWLGLVGFLILAVMSLFYGAVQTADDIP